jgi:glycosyltransferase involved in cell wall biosynthesis
MKLAIVAAICVERDAISAAAAGMASAAASLDGVERVDLFATHIARALEVDGHVVSDPWALLRHARFSGADVAIAHWGIHSSLFDAWTVLANGGPEAVVQFHNMTPVALADEHLRPQLVASRVQLAHLSSLPIHWWTYSEENRRALRQSGVSSAVRFVPFPIVAPAKGAPQASAARERSGPVRILSIGRLARAKGTDVLIAAAARMASRLDVPYSLELVGNPAYSAPEFVAEMTRRIGADGLAETVSIAPDVDDQALWCRLAHADIVVCPSLHEGLCVPVIEAYLAGARVVATDGGNLRFIVQPPDPVVPAGDPTALADALERTVREVAAGVRVDRQPAEALCRLFSLAHARRSLEAALHALAGDHPVAPSVWPAELSSGAARRAALGGVRPTSDESP